MQGRAEMLASRRAAAPQTGLDRPDRHRRRLDRAASSAGAAVPTVDLLSNQRAGTTGANLAGGVLTPAVNAFSEGIKTPVIVEATPYRPLPAKAALGLSSFYTSLLILMSGFIGATIINSFLDGELGLRRPRSGRNGRCRDRP